MCLRDKNSTCTLLLGTTEFIKRSMISGEMLVKLCSSAEKAVLFMKNVDSLTGAARTTQGAGLLDIN